MWCRTGGEIPVSAAARLLSISTAVDRQQLALGAG
jgi:hypothetical protein